MAYTTLPGYKVEWIDVNDDKVRIHCGCGWKGKVKKVRPVEVCVLTAGDPSPIGRCPDCEDLVYVPEEDKE